MNSVFQHKKLWLIAAVSAAAIFIAGCSEPAAQNAPVPAPEVAVLETKEQAVALTTQLPGRVRAYLVSEVRPQVNGIVKTRLFEEGADVQAGQTLYEIDDASYVAAMDSAKAALAKVQANLGVARVTANRHAELLKINAVSRQAYDTAQAQLKQAQADVAAAKAALETTRIHLDYTRITAAISGRIGSSNITPGALVSANQVEALATVQQLDPIHVDLTQSSVQLLQLRKALENGALSSAKNDSARVKLMLEDGSEYAHEGELKFSDAQVDPNTGMVTVRAVFPNPDYVLLPGMYVRAQVHEGVQKQAILLPQRAVTRNPQGQATALVLNQDNVVEQRVFEVDRTVADQWLVKSGIESGERLIVEGIQKVRPGAKASAVAWSGSGEQ